MSDREYRTFKVNEQVFQVPVSGSAVHEDDIRKAAGIEFDEEIILIDKENSTNRPVGRGEKLDAGTATEVVTTQPWQAAGRDLGLLAEEKRKLHREFGERNHSRPIGWT